MKAKMTNAERAKQIKPGMPGSNQIRMPDGTLVTIPKRLKSTPKKHMVDAKILEATIAQRDAALKRAHEEYENTQKMMTQRDDAQAEVRKATAEWNDAQWTIDDLQRANQAHLERIERVSREKITANIERDEAKAAQKREIERIQESVTNAEKIWCAQRDRHQAQIRAQADEIEKLKSTQAAPQRSGDVIVYVLRNKATGAFEDCWFKSEADYHETGNTITVVERIAINIEETRDFAREKLNPVERLAVFGEAE